MRKLSREISEAKALLSPIFLQCSMYPVDDKHSQYPSSLRGIEQIEDWDWIVFDCHFSDIRSDFWIQRIFTNALPYWSFLSFFSIKRYCCMQSCWTLMEGITTPVLVRSSIWVAMNCSFTAPNSKRWIPICIMNNTADWHNSRLHNNTL